MFRKNNDKSGSNGRLPGTLFTPRKSATVKRRFAIKVDPASSAREEHKLLLGHMHDSYFRDGVPQRGDKVVKFNAKTRYVVSYPHPSDEGRMIQQPIRLTNDFFVKPPRTIEIARIADDHVDLFMKLNHHHPHRIDFKAGQPYLIAEPHPEQSGEYVHTPVRFDGDFRINKLVMIDPSNLSNFSTQMLALLLKTYPYDYFYDVYEFGEKEKPKYYMLPIASDHGHIIYQPVRLAKPLVCYERREKTEDERKFNDPGDKYRYAVCERKPFSFGTEGEVYESKGTIRFVHGQVSYTEKKPEKFRVVKVLSAPSDHLDDISEEYNGDDRAQSSKALLEYDKLQRMNCFHVKQPVLTDEDRRAGLIMREFQGEELYSILVRDFGEEGEDGQPIPGTGNIFTVNQRMDLTIALFHVLYAQVQLNGLVNRDIKPANILVKLDAQNDVRDVKIIDFGLAKHKDVDDEFEAVGTMGFAAPEVFSKGYSTSFATDVYAMTTVVAFLWQNIESDRYAGLSIEHKEAITRIIRQGTHLFPEERPSAKQVRDWFVSMRQDRAQALEEDSSECITYSMRK